MIKLTLAVCLLATTVSCGPSKAYTSYLETLQTLNANRQAPGIRQTFDSDGRLLSQDITMPQTPIMPQQEQPSEWASVFRTALSVGLPVAGMVWNTYAAGEAFSNVAEAVQGNTSNSYNTTTETTTTEITETTETATTNTTTQENVIP
jgi:hypothetical protein